MYYLMKYENKKSFVFMLVSAEGGGEIWMNFLKDKNEILT